MDKKNLIAFFAALVFLFTISSSPLFSFGNVGNIIYSVPLHDKREQSKKSGGLSGRPVVILKWFITNINMKKMKKHFSPSTSPPHTYRPISPHKQQPQDGDKGKTYFEKKQLET